jgi:hypothetical protein
MFEIQKNVPVPKTRRLNAPPRKYPFREMEVGDMFFVPNKTKNTLMTLASTEGRNLGRKFSTKLCFMFNHAGHWEPCEPGTRGAIQGVGVWRVG